MRIRTLLTLIMLALMISVSGQNPDLVLTYTAIDNATNVQLASIKIMNRTQDCDTVLYWPDTVLVLGTPPVGTQEHSRLIKSLLVYQNYPNPVTNNTTIDMFVPGKDKVGIIITDVTGRIIMKSEQILDEGNHSYRFTPGPGKLYFFTAQWKGQISSIKILHAGFQSSGLSMFEYLGITSSLPQLKNAETVQGFSFSFGDTLLNIGYKGNLESGILDNPETDETYTFQFATNIPCPGTPYITYEGQFYNTIQIFSQCWLKENMNVGNYIPGYIVQSDNGIIEKYCYDNREDSCEVYGGLYRWDEMMQYTTAQGAQGICPDGWHPFTFEEWKVLEGAVDSQYGIGDPEWDMYGSRGFDAGLHLRTTYGWHLGENGTDLYGFSALPGGFHHRYDGFFEIFERADFWSGSEAEYNSAYEPALCHWEDGVHIQRWGKPEFSTSVRCIKD